MILIREKKKVVFEKCQLGCYDKRKAVVKLDENWGVFFMPEKVQHRWVATEGTDDFHGVQISLGDRGAFVYS